MATGIDNSDHVSLDSFELISLTDVLPMVKEKSEKLIYSSDKVCNVCKDVCSEELAKECSFAVKLKSEGNLCVNCQRCKLSQMQIFVKEVAAKLGFEVLNEDQENVERQESDYLGGKGSYSSYNFYPDRSTALFSSENNQRKSIEDDIDECISEIQSLCSCCCCYLKDRSCWICIKGNFTCLGSCPCCSSYKHDTERKCADDGIEVLYEEKDAPSYEKPETKEVMNEGKRCLIKTKV